MTIHADSATGHNHILHNFTYASAALRTGATYATTDVGKEVLQTDTIPPTFWRILTVNGSGIATFAEVAQPTKTINGYSIWGTGDIPIASTAVVDTAIKELQLANEYGTSRQRYYDKIKKMATDTPKAAIVVLLGQSLNVSRGTNVQAKSAPVAKMLVGGASVVDWSFFSNNNYHTAHWNSMSSVVDFTEGAGQSPLVGIINTLAGSKFEKLYLVSVAIGSTKVETLKVGGPAANLWGAMQQMCKYARADGYDPQIMFYTAHGEANAANSTTETDYYNWAKDYYTMAQMWAAQAMQNPDYIAPIVFTLPIQQSNGGDNDRVIRKAIFRLAKDIPNAIHGGSIWHWGANTDRIHPTELGYIYRGGFVGNLLRKFFESSEKQRPLHITDVTLSGTTFVAMFSGPVTIDTTLTAGENLNTALAEGGLEWIDNGAQIGINAGSLTATGWKVTGTLASAPTGTLAQQVLQIASQTTTTTLTSGISNLPGTTIRSTDPASVSAYDGSTYYKWAISQTFSNVRTA